MSHLDTSSERRDIGNADEMNPDDTGADGPTQPLPLGPGPTEPIIAPHVPVANLSTAPLDPVIPATARSGRSRALTGGLLAAVLLLGATAIAFLILYLQDAEPAPALAPTPSSSPTVTVPPSEAPTSGGEAPSEEPAPPAPEPTTPPEPTVPPVPEPTGTPAAEPAT